MVCLTMSTSAADSRRISYAPPARTAIASGGAQVTPPIRLVTKATDRSDFEASSDGVWVHPRTLDGRDFSMLELDGGGVGGEIGDPQIPNHGQFIQVPEGSQVRLVIDEVQWVDIAGQFTIMPRQEPPADVVGAKSPPFRQNAAAYQGNEFLPAQPVKLADRMKIRHNDMVYVMYTPIAWNPELGTMRAARFVRWHLEIKEGTASTGRTDRSAQDALGTEAFAPMVARAMDVRPDPAPEKATIQPNLVTGNGADYLIIVDPNFEDEIMPLANWKHQKGYKTKVVTTTSIASPVTATAIKDYIQDAYDTWNPAPTYVLLVGDSGFIPAHYKSTHPYHGTKTATDLYYATTDGTDLFPDIFLGRFPCATGTECTRMVNKTLEMEKNPTTDAGFYNSVLVAAYFQDKTDVDPSDGYEGRLFMETGVAVKDFFTSQGYSVDTSFVAETTTTPRRYNWSSLLHTNGAVYASSPTYLAASAARTAVSNSVNAGVWLVQHRDHGSTSGWGDPPFSTSEVNRLANSNKYPVVMTINCQTAWFDDGTDCFSEAWLKKATGGSHCVIGATRVSYSWWNDWMVHGFYECMYPNYMETLAGFSGYKPTLSYGNNYVGKGTHIGQILNYGKMMMYDKYAGGSQVGLCLVEFEIMTLLGDPEHSPRHTFPNTIAATYPGTLVSTIATNFNVTVTSGGSPLAGAKVALVLDPGDYHTATTSAGGVANFNFTPSAPVGGSNRMSIVISHPDYKPYTNSILINTLGMVLSLPTVVTEGDGLRLLAGSVRIPNPMATPVTVSLQSLDTTEVTVPASFTIPANTNTGYFSFTVVDDAILDGTAIAVVKASAVGFGDASDALFIMDNENAVISVSAASKTKEGNSPYQATVSLNLTPQYNFTVTLTSSDPSELVVPATVTIPAYTTSASFTITPMDDREIDGTKTAVITASRTGHTSGTASIQIADDESLAIGLETPEILMESAGTLAGAGRVTIGGTLATNVVVALSSSDPTELTVPPTLIIPAGSTSAVFTITMINDALVDGPQTVLLGATPFGLGRATNSITVYDDESPPAPYNPIPADAADNVIVTTTLDWSYFAISGKDCSNEVYLGTSPTLTSANKLGVTAATVWTPTRLAPMETYYWRVITRRGNLSTAGPVWKFSTRGVDHFTWSTIVSPEMAINPFGVIVSARDEFNTVVTNFTQAVSISGLVGSPAYSLFSESFEDGNFGGWTVGAGTYVRMVTNSTSAAGSNSVTLIGGNSTHGNGLSYNLGVIKPESVKFSVQTAANTKYAAYVVLGDSIDPSSAAAFFYARADGTMGVYEDVVGPHTVPYEPNQWYQIELVFDWDANRIHYKRDGVLVESNIPFRSSGVASLTTLQIYNFDNTQSWWDDFQIISSNQVSQIAVSPTKSPGFVDGYWSGSVAVMEPATNMVLLAEDSSGNKGQSGRFNVSINTHPAISVSDISTVEGETGSHQVTFSVRLNPSSATNVTVAFATANGTATAGTDYLATSGELSFTSGQIVKTVSVTVLSDNLAEGNEFFTLTLSSPFNALLSNSVAKCVIWDDELPPNLYVHSAVGQPWNRPDNAEAMRQALGANWMEVYFETINPDVLFSSAIKFIYMDGSDDNALTMEAFMQTNSARYTTWVAAGGLAFINSAPNQGNGMSLYLGNTLTYPIANGSTGRVAMATHPLATGPFTPAGTTYSGNAFAHASVSGLGLRPLIWDLQNTNQILVAEESYGLGNVVMGGLTAPTYHQPQPNADNLRANLIAWASDPKPYIECQDAYVIENDRGSTNLYFPITLSRAYGSNVTVNYGTLGITATAGVDYTVTSGTATFPPGVTTVNVAIPVLGDLLIEQPERLSLHLSSAVNGVILHDGTGTIIDDDQPHTAFLRSNVGEPWANGTAYTNAINAAFGASAWQSLFFETVNANALFSAATRFVYIEGGDDNAIECNAFLAANRTLIQDWVTAGGLMFLNAAPNEGADISAGFGVTLNYPDQTRTGLLYRATHPIASTPFSPVGLSWVGGSFAHATIQGTGLYPLVTDATNTTRYLVAEKAYGDGNVVFGGLTTFTFHTPSIQASNLFLNILKWASDPKPYASIDDTVSIEPDTGTSNIFFTVRLNRESKTNVSVNFGTSGLTAFAGLDYVATNGTLVFTPGTVALTVPVRMMGDKLLEGHETFKLVLTSATNAMIVDSFGIGTIIDNELPSVAYVRSSAGEPWGSLANSNALNQAFGIGGWQSLFIESADPLTLLSPATKFIFFEGSQSAAPALEAWLGTNSTALYNWVYAGGNAFINAAPTTGNGMYCGNGVFISYTGSNTAASVQSALPAHPLFAGPSTPTGTSYTGTQFAHGILTGTGLLNLLTNSANGTAVLAEKPYGSGTVLYGTMTTANYHSPVLNAANLQANILAWAADPKPYIYVSNAEVIEGDSGTTRAAFTVSMSRRDVAPVSVNFATAGGSATSGVDFIATNGILVFPAGTQSAVINVAVLGDTIGESTETFFLNVSNPTNCVILDSSGQGTILNDDIFLATLPFSETWESGLRPFWSLSGAGTYHAAITTSNTPYAGANHLIMDSTISGSFARNEATVNLAMSGYTNAQLRFFAKGFTDDYQAPPPLPFQFGADFDGVAISPDGIWWFPVLGLGSLTPGYQEFVANLDDTLELYGLEYTTPLYLRFVQYDNYPAPTDGIAFDNISVTAAPRVPVIVAAGASFLTESCPPGNGELDPAERVTLGVQLRNTGPAPSASLVATLLEADGVAAPTAPASYGRIASGQTVSQPFTFTVARPCGGMVVLNIALQNAGTNLGTVKLPIRVGGSGLTTTKFTNPNLISIPSSGPAGTYPSMVNVTGYSGTPSRVWVSLKGLSHSYPADIDILLMGPRGQTAMLLSDVGGGVLVTNLNLTFFEGASTLIANSTLESGIFSTLNSGAGDILPLPAPAGPYGADLTVFTGQDPNGPWQLFVVDDTSSDSGVIANGWELVLEQGTPACCSPAIPLTSARVGNNLQLTFTSSAGLNYAVEYTDGIKPGNIWSNWTSIPGNGAIINYPVPIDTHTNRFFRLRIQ